ncbi:MAG: redoxin domain-containing protein [Nitrospinota bacterium]
MPTQKFSSGGRLPELSLPVVGGGEVILGNPEKKDNWKLVFVYRGFHCPVCKEYLARLESLKEKFLEVGAEIIAVSGDPEHKANKMVEFAKLTFPVAYDLSI